MTARTAGNYVINFTIDLNSNNGTPTDDPVSDPTIITNAQTFPESARAVATTLNGNHIVTWTAFDSIPWARSRLLQGLRRGWHRLHRPPDDHVGDGLLLRREFRATLFQRRPSALRYDRLRRRRRFRRHLVELPRGSHDGRRARQRRLRPAVTTRMAKCKERPSASTPTRRTIRNGLALRWMQKVISSSLGRVSAKRTTISSVRVSVSMPAATTFTGKRWPPNSGSTRRPPATSRTRRWRWRTTAGSSSFGKRTRSKASSIFTAAFSMPMARLTKDSVPISPAKFPLTRPKPATSNIPMWP